jgi:hypothetical protein
MPFQAFSKREVMLWLSSWEKVEHALYPSWPEAPLRWQAPSWPEAPLRWQARRNAPHLHDEKLIVMLGV